MLRFSASCLAVSVSIVASISCDHPTTPRQLPATISAMTVTDQYAVAGSAVTLLPAVQLMDASGNPVGNGQVSFTVSAGGGTASPASATTDVAGIATLGSWTLGANAGVNTVTATSPDLAGKSVTFNATGLAQGFNLKNVYAGEAHTCGLTSTGAAYCWGSGGRGELGSGNDNQHFIPRVVDGGVSFVTIVGTGKRCGLTAAGAAYCWGYIFDNGHGGFFTITQPAAVTGGLTFQSITAGATHACGLTSEGTAYCWGENQFGQLGDGKLTYREDPAPVSGGLTFKAIAAGNLHTCGITTGGQTYCWGQNLQGEVGDGTKGNLRTAPVQISGGIVFQSLYLGTLESCGLTAAGSAYCWGRNNGGAIGDGTTTDRLTPVPVQGGLVFASLSVGIDQVCGLTAEGAGYCWGFNGFGQLGDGTTTTRTVPVRAAPGLKFQSLTTRRQTCGVTASGSTYCWGENSTGAMGNGTSNLTAPNPIPTPVKNP